MQKKPKRAREPQGVGRAWSKRIKKLLGQKALFLYCVFFFSPKKSYYIIHLLFTAFYLSYLFPISRLSLFLLLASLLIRYRLALAAGSDAAAIPRMCPVRGEYLVLHPSKRHLVKGNIYPVSGRE